MATQRKGDIAAKVAGKMGSSRAQGDAALNCVLDCIREGLSMGDRVVLTGFFHHATVRVWQIANPSGHGTSISSPL